MKPIRNPHFFPHDGDILFIRIPAAADVGPAHEAVLSTSRGRPFTPPPAAAVSEDLARLARFASDFPAEEGRP